VIGIIRFSIGKKLYVWRLFGDSFVFCDDERTLTPGRRSLRAVPRIWRPSLNFGVSGYGLGTELFAMISGMGLKFHPDIIFFNYISYGTRDDINPKLLVQKQFKKSGIFTGRGFHDKGRDLVSKSSKPYDLFDEELPRGTDLPSRRPSTRRGLFSSKFFFSPLTPRLLIKQMVLSRGSLDVPTTPDLSGNYDE